MTTSAHSDDPYLRAGILLAVALFVLYIYPGFLVPVPSHFSGSCKTIRLDASAEDLRVDPGNGLVYLTYYDRATARRKRTSGTVMLVDLNAAEPHVRAALSTEPAGFEPSGLSLYAPASGPKRLFVTSRVEPGKHSVEIFDQSPAGEFTPTETIRDPLLWSPTAIVAVGSRQFYVVNQLGYRKVDEDGKVWGRDRIRGNHGSVVYYDGMHMTIVARDLKMANGIAVSLDGRTVYVTESTSGRIQTFERDLESGALTPKDRIYVPGSPHNLTVDADGGLWVGTHPHAFPFMEMMRNPDDVSPTQVLRVSPSAPEGEQVEDIYRNSGDELSGGTVAARRGSNQFVVGSGTDHKLLLCTGAGPSPEPAGSG